MKTFHHHTFRGGAWEQGHTLITKTVLLQLSSSELQVCVHFVFPPGSTSAPSVPSSCSTSNAITAVASCVVSLITGALVGALVHYCAVRKKSKCHKFYSLTITRKQQKQQPAPVYDDIVAQKGTVDSTHIELRENIAYVPVQNWVNFYCKSVCHTEYVSTRTVPIINRMRLLVTKLSTSSLYTLYHPTLQKSICYLTIAFVTRVVTVDQNNPLWQPAIGGKTHMEYRKSWSCYN